MTGLNKSNAQAAIRSYVQRIENVQGEIDSLNADKSEIYHEAKGDGFDVKVLKAVVAYRRKVEKQGADAVYEHEAVFDLYLKALEEGQSGLDNAPELEHARVHAHEGETHSAGPSKQIPLPAEGRDSAEPAPTISQDPPAASHHPDAANSEAVEAPRSAPASAFNSEEPDLPAFLDKRGDEKLNCEQGASPPPSGTP